MAKYVVTVTRTEEHQITVFGEDESKAEDRAYRTYGLDLNEWRTVRVEKCEEENA